MPKRDNWNPQVARGLAAKLIPALPTDGGWVSLPMLIQEAKRFVPDEVASHWFLQKAEAGASGFQADADLQRRISKGRRCMVLAAMRSNCKAGRAVRNGEESLGKRAYRRALATLPVSAGSFDYSALDTETRIVVQQEDKEFNRHVEDAGSAFVRACHCLWRINDALKYKRPGFVEYINSKTGMSTSTAYKMLDVAKVFPPGGNIPDASKKALYLLAAPGTPEAARAEVLEAASNGERITPATVRVVVQRHGMPVPKVFHPVVSKPDDPYMPRGVPSAAPGRVLENVRKIIATASKQADQSAPTKDDHGEPDVAQAIEGRAETDAVVEAESEGPTESDLHLAWLQAARVPANFWKLDSWHPLCGVPSNWKPLRLTEALAAYAWAWRWHFAVGDAMRQNEADHERHKYLSGALSRLWADVETMSEAVRLLALEEARQGDDDTSRERSHVEALLVLGVSRAPRSGRNRGRKR